MPPRGPPPAAEAKTWSDPAQSAALMKELTGRELDPGYLEAVISFYRLAHPALKQMERQGEAGALDGNPSHRGQVDRQEGNDEAAEPVDERAAAEDPERPRQAPEHRWHTLSPRARGILKAGNYFFAAFCPNSPRRMMPFSCSSSTRARKARLWALTSFSRRTSSVRSSCAPSCAVPSGATGPSDCGGRAAGGGSESSGSGGGVGRAGTSATARRGSPRRGAGPVRSPK